MLLNGAETYVFTRPALAMNTLNLDAWFGYQEVFTSKSGTLRTFSFRYRVPIDSYFDVELTRRGPVSQGLRIFNSHKNTHSFLFETNADGEFINKVDVGILEIRPLFVWNSVFISYDGDLKKISFSINSSSLRHFDFALHDGSVGFRGNLFPAQVDDVKIEFQDHTHVEDDFSGPVTLALQLMQFKAACIFLAILGLVCWHRGHRFFQKSVAVTALLLSLAYAYDTMYWSRTSLPYIDKYLLAEPSMRNYTELARKWLFNTWYEAATHIPVKTDEHLETLFSDIERPKIFKGPFRCSDALEKKCKIYDLNQYEEPTTDSCRILFVGGSRGIGSGARNHSEAYYYRVYTALLKENRNCSLDILNITHFAEKDLINQVNSGWIERFNPHIIVIDFLYKSDRDLSYIMQVKEKARPGTTLIALDNTLSRHSKAMRESGFTVLPTFTLLNEAQGKSLGFVNWDILHGTSFAHRLIAEQLIPPIQEDLNRRFPLKAGSRDTPE